MSALVVGAACSIVLRLLWWRPAPAIVGTSPPSSDGPLPVDSDVGWVRRYRAWWSASAVLAGLLLVGPPVGAVLGLAGAVVVWRLAGTEQAAATRREQAQAVADLPHVVALVGSVLATGAAVPSALLAVSDALPGPASARLRGAVARVQLGSDPAQVWRGLAADPALGPLGRSLERAGSSGAPVADVIARLADELGRRSRGRAEEEARRVGVRAAVPLGLCLLPSFILLGIVPVAAGLLSAVL
ncbi:type II secretion system F family protein [Nocardioides acrostichi]|uniref:Type II secretion system F family protein n=1 Tax=Nocardioides acrostichi TaxID=2784339 RepID=A0A930Y8L9_9ACTN|nr:type II secretion system F family protein [Nocardioides acrostichi]MBF4163252.1 type II secretion system F family protein [Nocardioides acrostichi]